MLKAIPNKQVMIPVGKQGYIVKCGVYDCGWCFDKTDNNNSVDGACMFPEQCLLNQEVCPQEFVDIVNDNFGNLYNDQMVRFVAPICLVMNFQRRIKMLVRHGEEIEFRNLLLEAGLDTNTEDSKDRWSVNLARIVWKHQQQKIDKIRSGVRTFTDNFEELKHL